MFDQIERLAHATPFEPFILVLPNGQKLDVPHQDHIFWHPNKKTVVVADDSAFRIINVNLIVAIETKSAA